jgi:hypothetical protein
LLSVNGTRTETPMPTLELKSVSSNPAVRTTNTLAQPHPQPRVLPDHRRVRPSFLRRSSCVTLMYQMWMIYWLRRPEGWRRWMGLP